MALVYLAVQGVFSYAAETDFWTDRRRLSRIPGTEAADRLAASPGSSANVLEDLPAPDRVSRSFSLSPSVQETLPASFARDHAALLAALPAETGSIRKVLLPTVPAVRVVVHVQDAHHNDDAQKNIGLLLRSLSDGRQADLVALEGAFGAVDVSALRGFSQPSVLRKTADYLLRAGRISGPVHEALTGPRPLPPLDGIDDPFHYDANVEAYRRSAPQVEGKKKWLADQRAGLDRRKAAVFNPALLSFDRDASSYHDGRAELGAFVRKLAAASPSGRLPSSVRDFLAALDMESALDFGRVEAERSALVSRLVRVLNPQKVGELARWSAAYRLGSVRIADFYRRLRDFCRENGEDLSRFPAMDAYVRYVLAADRVDPDRLLSDMSALEKECYARLVRTPEESRLLLRSRLLLLSAKLVDFSLSPEEWAEYEAVRKASSSDEAGLSSFEDFYRQAHARDQAMADNLLKSMADRKASTAVLVTGGYHAPGVDERLRRAGVAVVSFVPRIEKLGTGPASAYLSVFTQEKTPLEKLFQGRTLFLASDPADVVGPGAPVAGATAAGEYYLSRAQVDRNARRWSKDEAGKLAGVLQASVDEWCHRGGALPPEGFSRPDVRVESLGEGRFAVTIDLKRRSGGRGAVTFTVGFSGAGEPLTIESAERPIGLTAFTGEELESFCLHGAAAVSSVLLAEWERFKAADHDPSLSHLEELPLFRGIGAVGFADLLFLANVVHRGAHTDVARTVEWLSKLMLFRHWDAFSQRGAAGVDTEAAPLTPEEEGRGLSSAEIANARFHGALNVHGHARFTADPGAPGMLGWIGKWMRGRSRGEQPLPGISPADEPAEEVSDVRPIPWPDPVEVEWKRGSLPSVVAGRYGIGEQIGAGALIIVFRAYDRVARREVAVGFKRPGISKDLFRGYFDQQKLSKEGPIVPVYDVGWWRPAGDRQEGCFVVMELMQEDTLAEMLYEMEGNPTAELFPVQWAVVLAHDLLRALAAVHHAGKRHNDVTPDNVFPRAGRYLLGDFNTLTDQSRDDSGVTAGKIAFMAPETLRDGRVGVRSDFYQLGGLLYDVLASRRPYGNFQFGLSDGEMEAAILRAAEAKEKSAPPIGPLRPDLPPAFADFIMRLLSVDPDGRPASDEAAMAELKSFAPQIIGTEAWARLDQGWKPQPVKEGPVAVSPAEEPGVRILPHVSVGGSPDDRLRPAFRTWNGRGFRPLGLALYRAAGGMDAAAQDAPAVLADLSAPLRSLVLDLLDAPPAWNPGGLDLETAFEAAVREGALLSGGIGAKVAAASIPEVTPIGIKGAAREVQRFFQKKETWRGPAPLFGGRFRSYGRPELLGGREDATGVETYRATDLITGVETEVRVFYLQTAPGFAQLRRYFLARQAADVTAGARVMGAGLMTAAEGQQLFYVARSRAPVATRTAPAAPPSGLPVPRPDSGARLKRAGTPAPRIPAAVRQRIGRGFAAGASEAVAGDVVFSLSRIAVLHGLAAWGVDPVWVMAMGLLMSCPAAAQEVEDAFSGVSNPWVSRWLGVVFLAPRAVGAYVALAWGPAGGDLPAALWLVDALPAMTKIFRAVRPSPVVEWPEGRELVLSAAARALLPMAREVSPDAPHRLQLLEEMGRIASEMGRQGKFPNDLGLLDLPDETPVWVAERLGMADVHPESLEVFGALYVLLGQPRPADFSEAVRRQLPPGGVERLVDAYLGGPRTLARLSGAAEESLSTQAADHGGFAVQDRDFQSLWEALRRLGPGGARRPGVPALVARVFLALAASRPYGSPLQSAAGKRRSDLDLTRALAAISWLGSGRDLPLYTEAFDAQGRLAVPELRGLSRLHRMRLLKEFLNLLQLPWRRSKDGNYYLTPYSPRGEAVEEAVEFALTPAGAVAPDSTSDALISYLDENRRDPGVSAELDRLGLMAPGLTPAQARRAAEVLLDIIETDGMAAQRIDASLQVMTDFFCVPAVAASLEGTGLRGRFIEYLEKRRREGFFSDREPMPGLHPSYRDQYRDDIRAGADGMLQRLEGAQAPKTWREDLDAEPAFFSLEEAFWWLRGLPPGALTRQEGMGRRLDVPVLEKILSKLDATLSGRHPRLAALGLDHPSMLDSDGGNLAMVLSMLHAVASGGPRPEGPFDEELSLPDGIALEAAEDADGYRYYLHAAGRRTLLAESLTGGRAGRGVPSSVRVTEALLSSPQGLDAITAMLKGALPGGPDPDGGPGGGTGSPAADREERTTQLLRVLKEEKNPDALKRGIVSCMGMLDLDVQSLGGLVDGRALKRADKSDFGGKLGPGLLDTGRTRIVAVGSAEKLGGTVEALAARPAGRRTIFAAEPALLDALQEAVDSFRRAHPGAAVEVRRPSGLLLPPGRFRLAGLNGLLPPGDDIELIAPEGNAPDDAGADRRLKGVPVRPLEAFVRLIEFLKNLELVIESQA